MICELGIIQISLGIFTCITASFCIVSEAFLCVSAKFIQTPLVLTKFYDILTCLAF